MTRTWHYDSPLGGITLAGEDHALTGLWFDGQAHFGSTLDVQSEKSWLPVFADSCRWLDGYFAGRIPDFIPKLDLRGTPFQCRVWQALLDIPYGQTRPYAAIARAVSCPSARAVGGAVGRNPISLIVPCHRVIGAGGTLTGYAGGVERKRMLLRLEQTGII
ncbi:MAG: methylated-DNA--[protein]-cysteine S-methyltransferase [Bacteroidales bacterium]|nr:methylated-DNA--[protein]-cysteine S-methyltransferase [Bacteroidales bacterium]